MTAMKISKRYKNKYFIIEKFHGYKTAIKYRTKLGRGYSVYRIENNLNSDFVYCVARVINTK